MLSKAAKRLVNCKKRFRIRGACPGRYPSRRRPGRQHREPAPRDRVRENRVPGGQGWRELAELALAEYRDGIAKEEQTALEAELKLARDELKHATFKIDQAKERYAKIKEASTGSVYDLSQEGRFEAAIGSAQREERKARLMVEQAESKLKVLREYSIPVNSKALTADVEKARSEELARNAKWELEQSKLLRMQRALTSALPSLTNHQKRMLTILDAAIPIEEQLSKKLAECEKAGDTNESLRKELNALAGRLVAVVEEGQDAEADAAWAKLSRNLRERLSLRRR